MFTVARFTLMLLLLWAAPLVSAQQDPAVTAPADQFFSGSVMDLPEGKVTVMRQVLGRNDKRTFAITPATKVEGKLRLKARVTVRYTTGDDGDVATSILVRSSGSSAPKK